MTAWKRIRKNKGSAGVNNMSISNYETNLGTHLYKLWNRMSSGCYFPDAVKLVEISKSSGGTRPYGIPMVSDRVAQVVIIMLITPSIEPCFHKDSYAYRPHRSAHDAVGKARECCWKYACDLDIDISKFYDTIDHELLPKINETIRSWHLNRHSNLTLEHLASDINPIVRGWMTYYGKFYPTRSKWCM